MLNMNTSETLFFHPILLIRIGLIIIFGIGECFLNKIPNFIRLSPNSTFNVHNLHGVKLLTRLRVGLSHLRE